jgi:acetyl-CoA/propionyl-CoA carboxylase biotin carboxyl carrier protein
VAGVPTGLPFYRALVTNAAFAPADAARPFAVHTRWIETEYRPGCPARIQSGQA